MSSSFEMFRQQRELLAALNQEAMHLSSAIERVRADLKAIAQHEALRDTLIQEQRWVQRTEAAVHAAQEWQRATARHVWPHMVWRWAALTTLALAATLLSVGIYAWVTKPYADEVAYLRARLAFVEQLERRMLQMTPAERRTFDALLKGASPK